MSGINIAFLFGPLIENPTVSENSSRWGTKKGVIATFDSSIGLFTFNCLISTFLSFTS